MLIYLYFANYNNTLFELNGNMVIFCGYDSVNDDC